MTWISRSQDSSLKKEVRKVDPMKRKRLKRTVRDCKIRLIVYCCLFLTNWSISNLVSFSESHSRDLDGFHSTNLFQSLIHPSRHLQTRLEVSYSWYRQICKLHPRNLVDLEVSNSNLLNEVSPNTCRKSKRQEGRVRHKGR